MNSTAISSRCGPAQLPETQIRPGSARASNRAAGEDELCAIHLRNRLEGRTGDVDAVRRLILAGGEVGRFHDPARPYLHPEDVDIALDIDRYDFALRVNFEDGRPVARIETPTVTTPKLPT